MSTETLAIVISAAGLLLGFIAAFAWMIKRSDEQFAGMRVEIADLRDALGGRISGVERELVEVKIAIARVEGPPRRLLTER